MMKYGLLASIFIAAVGQVAWLGAGLLAAQGQNIAGAATDWTVPRTAWGDPDLQGKWSTARRAHADGAPERVRNPRVRDR